MSTPVTITRVMLKNYKSIASCDVPLGPLTLLVGRNGSGKSNFLDALSFVADCLRTTLEQGLRERGGVAAVSRRTGGTFPALGLRVDFALLPFFLSFLSRAFGFGHRQQIHPPQDRRQSDEQCQVGYIVDEAIGQEFPAGPSFHAQDERENQIAHPGTVRHDQRAEHRPFDAPCVHGFQPPNHQE